MDTEEKIKEIEDEIRRTQHNKATEHHIGNLRGKIAKLRDEITSRGSGKKGGGYLVKKEGDATVMIVGFPSVGKSTLINRITSAESRVGSYDFTTLTAIPGMMYYNSARIQVIDLPGIIDEASKGKGRGREVLGAARTADLILIVLEAGGEGRLGIILKELYDAGIRLDKKKPDVIIKKMIAGGLKVQLGKGLDPENVKAVLRGLGLVNAEVVIRKKLSDDEIIDAVLANRHYCPSLIVVNKTDELKTASKYLQISGMTGKGIESMKAKIWEKLGLLRIYTKKPGQEASSEALIMRKPVTPLRVVEKLRIRDVKYAKVWGKSVKHEGQRVNMNHQLSDMDTVSFH